MGLVIVVKNLQMWKGSWRVRVAIPADVRSLIGKLELVQGLGTKDDHQALVLSVPIITAFKNQIHRARDQIANRERRYVWPALPTTTPPTTSASLPTSATASGISKFNVSTTTLTDVAAFDTPLSPVRMSLSTTTTVYLIARAVFSAGTIKGYGLSKQGGCDKNNIRKLP